MRVVGNPSALLAGIGVILLSACGLSAYDANRVEEQLTSNDPLIASQQWHLNEADIPNAWNVATGSPSTIVAVIDSGQMPHPDLDGKWVTGYDFFAGDADPSDDGTYHHGIHTAGIIAATTNNGVGVAGTCWGCRLMPLRAAQSGGFVDPVPGVLEPVKAIGRAIRYAAGYTTDDGQGNNVHTATPAAVVNISLGNIMQGCTPELQTAINDANNAGTVVVASAGNNDDGDSNSADYLWPTCQNVIVVTAAQENGVAEPYAINGAGITLAAPGGSAVNGEDGFGALINCTGTTDTSTSFGTHGVVSTWVTADNIACYRHWSGTSMSAPVVSGIVALMKSLNPALTASQVKTILTSTARAACSGCGAGIVDAAAAVGSVQLSATLDCEITGGGRFSCTAGLSGLAPFTGQWIATGNDSLAAPTNNPSSVVGRCFGNLDASVTLNATDSLGRTITAHRSFRCVAPPVTDFDADGRTDLAVWRPSDGTWFVNRSSDNTAVTRQWGLTADVSVAGDYDGDGKTDFAVWRPSNGTWFVIRSSDGTSVTRQWGRPGDIPVPGDFDGDGKTDFAVWRPNSGTWFVIRSSDSTSVTQQLGLPGDVPVAGDFDGDGKTDFAVWRPSSGTWFVIHSSGSTSVAQQLGLFGDVPVAGDFDGDRRTDLAVWRPSSGTWFVIRSSDGATITRQWGLPGDVPVVGDFDADGITDFAVWRPTNGTWFMIRSSDGTTITRQWGLSGDQPVSRPVGS